MIENHKVWTLDKKHDNRGWFLKIFDGKEEFRDKLVGDVYFVSGRGKNARGNHYHRATNEWFFIVTGSCVLKLQEISGRKVEEIFLSEDDPKLVYVPSEVAHVFYSENAGDFIIGAFTDTIYDPEDTIPFKII